MLPTKWNLLCEPIAQRNEQIDRKDATHKYRTDGQCDKGPIPQELTHMDFQANQEKHERIHHERNVLPERFHRSTGASTHPPLRAKIAEYQTRRYSCNHTRQVQMKS